MVSSRGVMELPLVPFLCASVCFSGWLTLSASEQIPDCDIGKLDEVSLAECGNKGYAMRCGNADLTEIPKAYPKLTNESDIFPPLCLLDLSHNDFYIVGNLSFVHVKNLNSTDVLWLYLDYSNISYIASNAFDHLTNLLYLNLSGNHLNLVDSFEHGVFKPLVSLKNINFKENRFETFEIVGKELIYLANLTGLFIDLCPDCVFGPYFNMLPNLVNLSLTGRSKKACYKPLVNRYTFLYVPRTQNLFMSSCHVRNISPFAFAPLTNLSLLDISYNEELTFSGMDTALYGLRSSPTLKILNVNRIHTQYETGIQLKLSDINNLKTLLALEVLYMDLNKIEVFDAKIFQHFQFPSTLRILTLSGNRLTYGQYTSYLQRAVGVSKLDISRQHMNFDPFFHEHYEAVNEISFNRDFLKLSSHDDCPMICSVCLPTSLKKLEYRQSVVRFNIESPLAFCGAGGLKHLDMSFNLLLSWNNVIFGLDNMTHLDLSENYCSEVSPVFFIKFISLEHLNISGNMLGQSFDPELKPKAVEMFKWQHNLRTLDMSFNKIARLPEHVFEPLTKLEHLNLSGNIIYEWNCSLNTRYLRDLDLSGNKLFELPKYLTTYLDALLQDRYYNETIIVHLSANPLECNCNTLPFLKWMRYSRIKVLFRPWDACRLNGVSYRFSSNEHLKHLVKELENDKCRDKSWIVWTVSSVCCVLTGVFSVVACVLVYKNRWKLRYIYYSRNRRYMHKGFERLFDYDAFVSYAKNNASFIKNQTVPVLETQHGLRLWVADRNSLPGTTVAENICHGIYNSRKSVLLVNKEYLVDNWCNYEMNMSNQESVETNRKLMIIVLMESIPTESLPISVIKFLRSERSLEFPDEEQNMGAFWMNLADEINSNPE